MTPFAVQTNTHAFGRRCSVPFQMLTWPKDRCAKLFGPTLSTVATFRTSKVIAVRGHSTSISSHVVKPGHDGRVSWFRRIVVDAWVRPAVDLEHHTACQ